MSNILKEDAVELEKQNKCKKGHQRGLEGSEKSSGGGVPLARPQRMDETWVEGRQLGRRLR